MPISLADVPLIPPPPGEVSNFVDPESRRNIAIVCSSLCMALMWPIVLLRLYTKVWITRSFGWDDASTIVASIGSTAYAGSLIWGMSIIGPHAWNVRLISLTEQFTEIAIVVWELVYGITVFFDKLALLLLYLRMFSRSRPTEKFVYIGIAVNGAYYLGTTFAFGILCIRRPGETWVSAGISARCHSSKIFDYIGSVFSIVSDIYIFVLPLPALLGLNLPVRKKLGISAIFLTGVVAIVASIIGLYYRVIVSSNDDLTWTLPLALTLITVELAIGVICGSMPYLASFFRRHKLNISRITSLRHLLTRVFRKSAGYSENSDLKPDTFHRLNSTPPASNAIRVETCILGSIQGDGKFVKSGNFSRHWQDRSMVEPLRSQSEAWPGSSKV